MCPYAASARLWAAPSWQPHFSLGDFVATVVPHLVRFSLVSQSIPLDGFLIALPNTRYETFPALARLFNATLRYLHKLDPTPVPNHFDHVLHEDWQFTFNQQRFFIIVMSDLYDEKSTRETYAVEGSFIFLQPESSFAHYKIPRAAPKEPVREGIRTAFEEVGKSYRGKIIGTPFEAPRYLKPLSGVDQPCRWWETDVRDYGV
jgi:hypothetical protein